jgi:hypothetical protein
MKYSCPLKATHRHAKTRREPDLDQGGGAAGQGLGSGGGALLLDEGTVRELRGTIPRGRACGLRERVYLTVRRSRPGAFWRGVQGLNGMTEVDGAALGWIGH